MQRVSILLATTLFSITVLTSCNGRLPVQPKPVDPKPSAPAAPTPPTDPLPSVPTNPNPTLPVSGNAVDLNIVSFNCWGLPNPITKNLKDRMNKIGPAINGFDIVNLQETFSDHSEVIFKTASYPYKYRYDNSSFLTLNGGLGTLSKFPIKQKKFRQFTECAGSDCMSNKGVFFVRLTVPQIGDVDVYNTHYQAIESKDDIRIADNRILEAFIKENEVGNLTIMTGDFNYPLYDQTDSTSKAYTDLKKRLNPIDTFRVANPTLPGFTHDATVNTYGDKDGRPQRLDFIFVLPESRSAVKESGYRTEVLSSKVVFNQPFQGTFLSDHFGINTKLRVYSMK